MRCKHCRTAARVDCYCVRHAIATAVARHEDQQAKQIAREHGWPVSAALRMIRDRDEKAGSAWATGAIPAA